MSGLMHGAQKKLRREKEKLFSIRLFGNALGDIEYDADGTAQPAGGDDAMLHDESYDLSAQIDAVMQARLGKAFADLHKLCSAINSKAPQPILLSPGPTPPAVDFTFTVTTSAAIWKLIEENARWSKDRDEEFAAIVQDRAGKCCARILDASAAVKSDLDKYHWMLDATGQRPEQKYLDQIDDSMALFRGACEQQVDVAKAWVESQFGTWLYARVRQEHKNAKAIIATRGRKGAKVAIAGGVIGGHIAHAAASWGATAPLAFIGIMRQSVEIGFIVVRAGMSMKTLAKEINGRVNWLVAKYAGDKKVLKGIESLLNLAKGVTGIETPSLDSCKDLIEEYEHKILTLEASYNQLQRELAKATGLLDFAKAELKRNAATLAQADIDAAMRLIIETRQTCTKLEDVSQDKDDRVQQARQNVEVWNAKLDQIAIDVGRGQKLITAIGTLTVSVAAGSGESIGAGADAIDAGKSAIEATVEMTHSFLIDMGMQIAELPGAVMDVLRG